MPSERSRLRRAVAAAPWWAKVGAKLGLARLHIGYGVWSRLSLFKHGPMDEPPYAQEVFSRHLEHVRPADGFVALEVGPGDTAFSALVGYALGASRTILVDVGAFARQDVGPYLEMAGHLRDQGLRVPELSGAASLDDVLELCSAEYLTDGVESLRALDDASVDFSFSHAVLEHVRAAELPVLMRELRRLTKPAGASSHLIDLQDHLGFALNNLRFSDRVWESRLFASSGFYTNRLRRSQLLAVFEQAGFETEIVGEARWPELPTPRARIAPRFRGLPDDDLLVHSLEVVLRPRAET